MKTIIFRAHKICCDYTSQHNKSTFLVKYFSSNEYLRSFVYYQVIKFVSNIMHLKHTFYTAEKCQYFLYIPHIGPYIDKLKFESEKVIGKYMPQINLHFVFANTHNWFILLIVLFNWFVLNYLPFDQRSSFAYNKKKFSLLNVYTNTNLY